MPINVCGNIARLMFVFKISTPFHCLCNKMPLQVKMYYVLYVVHCCIDLLTKFMLFNFFDYDLIMRLSVSVGCAQKDIISSSILLNHNRKSICTLAAVAAIVVFDALMLLLCYIISITFF